MANWLDFRRAILILIIVGLAAYTHTLSFPFVHDDLVFIRYNPHIAELNLSSIFFQTNPYPGESSLINNYYRPLLEVVYRLEYKIFHFNPAGYHLVNVLIHISNAILVFVLLSWILIRENISTRFPTINVAFLTALLFLIHPVQTEAVACIAGISNLLFTLLCLLSFYCYLRANSIRNQSILFYGLALGFFFLSLFAKEQSIVLPFLILLYEICRRDDNAVRVRKISRVLGFLVVLAGYLSLRRLIFGSSLAFDFSDQGELLLRLATIPKTILMYLGILVFPFNLHYYRSTNLFGDWVVPFLILAAILIILFGCLRMIPQSYRGLAHFALGWFFISLLPTLNIVPLIIEYSWILTSEHFLYLPLVGFSFYIVFLGYVVLERLKRTSWAYFISGAMALIFLFLTVIQTTYWRSEIVLFKRALTFQNDLGRVHVLLAKAYYFDGKLQQAVDEYAIALSIMQGYLSKVRNPEVINFYRGFIKGIYFDQANSYQGLGQTREAIIQLKKAVELDPTDANLENNLGYSYAYLDDVKEAMNHFRQAYRLDPNNLSAMNNIAIGYLQLGQKKEAEELLRQILKKDSNFKPAKDNLERLSTGNFK